MIQYFVGGLIAYTAYNIHEIWDDIVSYCEMKAEEYTRIYTYDSYDLDTGITTDTVDKDKEPSKEPINEHSKDKDNEENEISPFEDDVYMNCAVSILDRWKQEIIQTLIGLYFDALTLYCAFENRWLEMARTYVCLHIVHSVFVYAGRLWKRMTCGHLVEPYEKIWVDNVSIYRVKQEDGTFVYNMNESYSYPHSYGGNIQSVLSEMKRCIERNASRSKENVAADKVPIGVIDVIGHLVIGKYTDISNTSLQYIVSIGQIPEPDTITSSKAHFMSVEYMHPRMSESIPLEIPHEMLVSGNILLSYAFVLRALLHQPKKFIFDMDYKLKIVDAMVNIFELKSCNHIVLNENGYAVRI